MARVPETVIETAFRQPSRTSRTSRASLIWPHTVDELARHTMHSRQLLRHAIREGDWQPHIAQTRELDPRGHRAAHRAPPRRPGLGRLPGRRRRADQIVRARVVWRTRQGIAVPALAVTWLGGQPFVYVVQTAGGGAIARQRPVKLGELADRAYPVVSGLALGEQIVAGGIQKLRDGAPIAVQGAGQNPPREQG